MMTDASVTVSSRLAPLTVPAVEQHARRVAGREPRGRDHQRMGDALPGATASASMPSWSETTVPADCRDENVTTTEGWVEDAFGV